MEDDDEFGDLYTDVLRPFSSTSTTSSSSVAPQPHQPSPTPAHPHRPIDLNLQSLDDDSTLFGVPRPIPATQTLAPFKSPLPPPPAAAAPGALPDSIPKCDSTPEPMVLDSKQELNDGKDVKFDIEEGGSNGIEDIGSDDPIIPGLTESVRQEDSGRNNSGNDNEIRGGQAEAEGEGDDWDSDSEDDLQIVLNDNNHGPMAMEGGGMMGDDDEDGDPLVIVADGDANQGMEEQDWGEEGGQAADGERKEGVEAGKVGGAGGGGSVIAPKIGYSNHGYHPFHSQFKVSVLTC